MQSQVKSFQEYGNGIYSSSTAVPYTNWRSSWEVFMNIEWAQTTIFLLAPLFFMLIFIETNEDDDGPPDGGMMQPVYASSPS